MRRLLPQILLFMALLAFALPALAGPKHAAAAAPPVAREEPEPAADPVKAEPAKAEPAKAEPAGEQDVESPPPQHDPVMMKIGIKVLELNKFDVAQGTYTAEFLVFVHCDKEPCKPNLELTNGKISGKMEKLKDEPLNKEFKMKAELTAILDFSSYPFDNHYLPIELSDKGDPEQIKYELDTAESGVKESIKLPGWNVSQWLATVRQDDAGDNGKKLSSFVFLIQADRPTLMATFKSVVPVLIMLFVAAFTLLLKPKSAAGRLSAATGGLMSIVMFQVGQVGSLPPLGYLTRLDKFMIATYLVYLLNIAFSVLMVRAEEKKNERASELLYLAAAGAVPGIALVGWVTVFLKLV